MARSVEHGNGVGSSIIPRGAFEFAGQRLLNLSWNGRECWLLTQVNEALGYADGVLSDLLRREWSDEFERGVDYEILEGTDLQVLRETLLAAGLYTVSSKARSTTALFESGVFGVCLKTDKPEGANLRRKLRQEVLPEIRKTGSYAGPAAITPTAKSPALALAQQMLSALLEQERKTEELEARTGHVEARQADQDDRLEALETGVHALPAGIGTIQIAEEAGWLSEAGRPHNSAVISACVSAGFAEDGRLYRRREWTTTGLFRPTWYLSARGAADFYATIDAAHAADTTFAIDPTTASCAMGHKARYVVCKRAGEGDARRAATRTSPRNKASSVRPLRVAK